MGLETYGSGGSGRGVGIETARYVADVPENSFQLLHLRTSSEAHLGRAQLGPDIAHRPHVNDGRVPGRAQRQLRRAVVERHEPGRVRAPGFRRPARQAEVGDLDPLEVSDAPGRDARSLRLALDVSVEALVLVLRDQVQCPAFEVVTHVDDFDKVGVLYYFERADFAQNVGYLVFELPGAFSPRLSHPNWAYGIAVIICGILATSISAVRSYAPIMVVRAFLRFAEAFVQTCFGFLSLWYRREHELILQRTAAVHNTPDGKPRLFRVWWALKDPKTWLFAMAIAAASMDVAALGAFLPTFIHQFEFCPRKGLHSCVSLTEANQARVNTQLYTIIPYVSATVSEHVGR
ncbi:hypothetical protein AYL99_12116 [Fonsecaea erecta]|uniref:Uncharacterized protein n=1 Tax=Fonsecaea erecta TaxID=1367422 RepID=A0A178Z1N2_9EURO|nr:hypothetical protein AYL99_12116 [Fonsecaea erecta]OAP53710.1 hypothetical protein AYL99_12116 [Fonsecaea erecta]